MAAGAPRCCMTGARVDGRSSRRPAPGGVGGVGARGGVSRGGTPRPGGGGPMRRITTGTATATRPRTGRGGGPAGGAAAAPAPRMRGTSGFPLRAAFAGGVPAAAGGTSGLPVFPRARGPIGGRLPAILGGAV